MTDQAERNPDGTFRPGHAKSGGRSKDSDYRLDKLRSHFTNGRFEDLLTALDKGIKRGDAAIIRLVLEYLLGKPQQTVDLNSTGDLRIRIVNDSGIGSEAADDDSQAS